MKKVFALTLSGLMVTSQLSYAAAPKKPVAPVSYTTQVYNLMNGVNSEGMSKAMFALAAFQFAQGYTDKKTLLHLGFSFMCFAYAHPHKLAEKLAEARAAGLFTEKGMDAAMSTSLTVALAAILGKYAIKGYKQVPFTFAAKK